MSPKPFFNAIDCYASEAKHHHIPVLTFTEKEYDQWIPDQDSFIATQLSLAGFHAKEGDITLIHNKDGDIDSVLLGLSNKPTLYEFAAIPEFMQNNLSNDTIVETTFSFDAIASGSQRDVFATLGWGLGCYSYNQYKNVTKAVPKLLAQSEAVAQECSVKFDAIAMLRNLVNTPANDLGPVELEAVAHALAAEYGAKFKSIKGSALKKGFPLVHAVGQAAVKERSPRLLEIKWGNKNAPKLTLVGKGVCFDTGGLDIKAAQYMGLMKKDMGGAAHVLALAKMIMAFKIDVCLRVLVPAVENCVGGNAFRPGDVFTSRSGITVENTDTDAEGRLILADTLSYASENDPELIVDFATLTGSARAALGQDIPAVFTNDTDLEVHIRSHGRDRNDPIWPMPLHSDYKNILKSDIADIANHAPVAGDLIYSAIFLEHFVKHETRTPNWIHVDCFSWESNGRPGRSKGGRDTGLQSVFSIIEKLYC